MSMSPTRKKLIQNKVADLFKVFFYLKSAIVHVLIIKIDFQSGNYDDAGKGSIELLGRLYLKEKLIRQMISCVCRVPLNKLF